MNPERIKEAYAYGASLALQELGFNEQQAQAGGVKLAAENWEEMGGMTEPEASSKMNPALAALIGAGAGTLGGAALGAGSALIPGLRGRGLTNLIGKSDALTRGAYKIMPQRLFAKDFLNPGSKWSGVESYLRGVGGAGLGALGGGLAGKEMAS